jgi:predicted PurR-regulated permease PerM
VPNQKSPAWPRPLVVWAGLVLIVASLYWASAVMMPVVLAILVTFILSPLVAWLQRRGLGRVPAVLVVALFVSCLLFGIGWAVAAQFRDLAAELPKHRDTIIEKIGRMHPGPSGPTNSLIGLVKDVSAELDRVNPFKPSETAPPLSVPVVVQNPPPTSNVGWFSQIARPLGETLAGALFAAVLVLFMLIYREDLRNRVIRLAGLGQLTSTTRVMDEAGQRISRYLIIQVLINVTFGLIIGVAAYLIGVPYFLLWGILCGLLRFIPYLGTWVGGALLLVFTIAVSPGWREPLITAAVFFTVEMVAANVAEPLLFGKGTGLSPVALVISAALWTWLWGPVGLILSTPIMTCLVVLGKYIPQMELVEVLLGDGPGLDTEVSYYQRLLARDQDEATELVDEYLTKHSPDSVFDEVLVPALVLAKQDRDRGELTPPDEQRIFQVTQQVIEALPADGHEHRKPADNPTTADGSPVLVVGYAGQDAIDRTALLMFDQLMEANGWAIEVLAPSTVASEAVTWVRQEQPAVIVIAAVPPGGLAQAQYLCKRLRASCPKVKILVGRWGATGDVEHARARLTAAGADVVAATLLEARGHLLPWLNELAQAPAPTGELAHAS